MSAAASIQERVQQATQEQVRQVHTFDFPKGVITTAAQSVGIHEITADEEVTGTTRAKGNAARVGYELAIQSLAQVNGKPVNLADGSADKAWKVLSSKQRLLAVAAFNHVNAVEESELQGFLSSQRVQVG